MKFGKLLGQVIATPIKITTALPEVAADVVDEIGKAITGDKKKEEK